MSPTHGLSNLVLPLASKSDTNIELSYVHKQAKFYGLLNNHRPEIEDLVGFHMGLNEKVQCLISDCSTWISGNFNVCIPAFVQGRKDGTQKKVIIRIPLPYKLGESENAGNVEEKVRCEAATYIWIRNNCPSVPIPRLWGFGFTGGLCVSDSSSGLASNV